MMGLKAPRSNGTTFLRRRIFPQPPDIGKRTVFVWEENAVKLHEEDAARRLASMRIVPLVTKEEQVIRAETLCKGKSSLICAPTNI